MYDASGSLVFDGSYAYQYDAWGRLVRISEAEANAEGFVPGKMLKEYRENELRYRMLRHTNAEHADEIYAAAQEQIERHWKLYEQMAEMG